MEQYNKPKIESDPKDVIFAKEVSDLVSEAVNSNQSFPESAIREKASQNGKVGVIVDFIIQQTQAQYNAQYNTLRNNK